MMTQSPSRCTVQRLHPPDGRAAWHSAARKALKSCSPSSSRGRGCMRSASSGRRIQARAARRQRRARRTVEDVVAIGARFGASSGRGNAAGTGRAQRTLMSAGRFVLAPSTQPRALRRASVSKCATWRDGVHAGIGAAGADQAHRFGRRRGCKRRLDQRLHAGAERCVCQPRTRCRRTRGPTAMRT